MSSPLVILVEDEEHLAAVLLFNLEVEGFAARHFADGAEALAWLLQAEEPVAAILLDVMLPGLDGFSIARALREKRLYWPILMMTARGSTADILEGLEAGADDYLSKPFDLDILLARLRTLLRRVHWQRLPAPEGSAPLPPPKPSADVYSFAGREIHFDTLELLAPGKSVTHLTLMEADLLRYLTERPGQIVSRKELLEQVWRVREDTDTRAVDNFIVRLRRYLEDDPGAPTHLLAVRGVGYRFLPDPQASRTASDDA